MNDIQKQFLQHVAYGSPEEVRLTLKNHPELLNSGSIAAEAIHKATESNRGDIIPLLAEYGVDINSPDESGQTPLMNSVRFRNPALVNSLIQAGANPNVIDKYNQCALYYASSQADGKADEIVPLLISSGADATYVDPEGNSPLHIAARFGFSHAVLALLEGGADPLQKQGNLLPVELALSGDKFNTARVILQFLKQQNLVSSDILNRSLLMACRSSIKESSAFIQELLGQGADVNYKGLNGLTPLHNAAGSGNISTVELLLLRGADVNAVDGQLETPLHRACSQTRSKIARLLLEHNATPDAISRQGTTPLHIAVYRGKIGIATIRVLLEAGADTELRANNGLTALGIAKQNAEPLIASLLLKESDRSRKNEALANIQLERSIKDKKVIALETLFSRYKFSDERLIEAANLAILARSEEVIAFLLKQGLKPDAKDSNGNLIVFLVFEERLGPGLLHRFLEAGLDPLIQDENGNGLLHILSACWTPTHGYISQLDRPQWYSPSQLEAVRNLIEKLLNKQVSPDVRNKIGQTPLHLACQYADLETVKLYVSAGGTLEITDNFGNSMLHYAARGKNQTEIVEYLLQKGMSPTEKTDDGSDAMTLSSASGSSEVVEVLFKTVKEEYKSDSESLMKAIATGKEDIILRLIEHGSDPNAEEDGRSALMYATEMGMFSVVQALLETGANPDFKNRYGRTCLHSAAGRGDVKILKLLIDSGANIAAGDGLTVAMSAAGAFSLDALKLLKENGADLSAKARGNYTPLMALARSAFHRIESPAITETVMYLVSEGVGVNDVDDYGNTALDYACGANNLSGTDEPPACVMVVKALLACGADPGMSGKGSAAYSHASRLGFKTICQILLKTDKRE